MQTMTQRREQNEMAGQARKTTISRRNALQTVGGGAMFAGLMLAQRSPQVGADAAASADNPIIGAWMTHAGSTTGGNVQANLLAFMPGGIVMHAASNFPQSAGIGAWYDAGDGTVVYTLIFRRMDKATGAYIGSTRLNARVTVAADGQSYTSPYTTTLTDPDDNVTTTGTGMSKATRIVATPPDATAAPTG
jgi:hypothetical protein